MEDTIQGQSRPAMPAAWQLSKNLIDCMTELYDNSLWTDVKFRCKDHEENGIIHAHKIVLSARSPVFQAMFFGVCADGKEEVYLEQAETKTLDLLLRYMYSDTVNLAEENASSVLEIAHYYQVTSLVQVCSDYLASTITSETACGILNLAIFYELTTLRDASCTFIDENADKILNWEGFFKLSEDCLTYILKGDTFHADEDDIFIKAEEWSKRKLEEKNLEKTGPNIRKTLGGAFYFLRLPSMKYNTLIACTHKKGYFSVEEYENIVDFINKIPDSSVESNSCIARLPTKETLLLQRIGIAGKSPIGDGNHSLSTAFQISVSRDVILTNFVLAKIHKCLKYDNKHFSDANSQVTTISEPSINNFFTQYHAQALKVYYPHRSKQVQTLQAVLPEGLPDALDIVIYGNLKVTSHDKRVCESNILRDKCNKKKAAKTDGNRDEPAPDAVGHDSEENEFGFSGDDQEEMEEVDLDGGYLIYEQDFKLKSFDIFQRRIYLREPFTMTKAASPYTVEMTLKYSCKSCIKMVSQCANEIKSVQSKHGHVHIYNIHNQGGIKSIGLENISNREKDKEISTKEDS